jgi:wyosine [tRNA(Phe)-imidazoG37] synthetase (radical SAM superfamily)
MKKDSRPVYQKQNSFFEIRHQEKSTLAATLTRIANIRQRDDLIGEMSLAHRQIFNQVCKDLLDLDMSEKPSQFTLSPNVVDEIATYSDFDLPRYLVHRYRYEIYPHLKILDEYPPYLQIEPSSVCNFRCIFCFETDPTFTDKSNGFMGQMTLDLFKHIIDQAEGNVEFLSLASRGEPMICKDIVPMLEYTQGKFLNLKLNTNASLLDEEKCHAILAGGVKTIVFSADAAEEPLYSKFRVNGKLSVILKNIELFQKIRQTDYPNLPVITRVSGVKFSDEQDLDSMQKVWGRLVDQVAFVQYNPWENVYNQPANRIDKACSDLWRRMFVWWDGKANPCDVDYKSTLSQGSIKEFDLSELWQSSGYKDLRADHINSKRESRKPCSACTVI